MPKNGTAPRSRRKCGAAPQRGATAKNAEQVKDNTAFAAEKRVDLRSIELDVQDQGSIEAAIQAIIDASGRIDVLVQNAGHMVYGPTEAFTTDQLAQQYQPGWLAVYLPLETDTRDSIAAHFQLQEAARFRIMDSNETRGTLIGLRISAVRSRR